MAGEKTLIYKEDLLNTVLDHFGIDLAYLGRDLQFCQEAIDLAPAVDAVEVVHARWEEIGVADYKCSRCGFRFTSADPISMFQYCRCGAKMDGGNEDG